MVLRLSTINIVSPEKKKSVSINRDAFNDQKKINDDREIPKISGRSVSPTKIEM